MDLVKALNGAVEMLMEIRCGGSFSPAEYDRRLTAFKKALTDHHREQLRIESSRRDLRALSERKRSLKEAA